MPRKEYGIVLRAAESDENLCFVARPFHSAFDAIYDAIQVAAARCNLKACTTIDFRDDKDFTQKFIRTIASAKLVVAVCSPVTHSEPFLANDNVMYELGMAHILCKKTLILTADSENRPSDILNRIFFKYSTKTEDHQQNIQIIEKAINTTLAGRPDFLDSVLKDDIWNVESVQYLFTNRKFWQSFNIVNSQIATLLDDFSTFQVISVVPCKSQLDEMLGRGVEASLSIRKIFQNQWPTSFHNYETCIAPHIADLKSAREDSIQNKLQEMIELASEARIKQILGETQEVWIDVVKEIENCHEYVINFKKIATYNNIIAHYEERKDILHEQFNSIESSIQNVHNNINLLLRNLRKLFSPGE